MLFLMSDGSCPRYHKYTFWTVGRWPCKTLLLSSGFAAAHSAPLSSGLSGVAGYQRRMVEVGDMSPVLLPQLDFF